MAWLRWRFWAIAACSWKLSPEIGSSTPALTPRGDPLTVHRGKALGPARRVERLAGGDPDGLVLSVAIFGTSRPPADDHVRLDPADRPNDLPDHILPAPPGQGMLPALAESEVVERAIQDAP